MSGFCARYFGSGRAYDANTHRQHVWVKKLLWAKIEESADKLSINSVNNPIFAAGDNY